MARDGETFSRQAVQAAYGWNRPQSWTDALGLIAKAAEAGEPEAERQLKLVTQASIETLLTPPSADSLTSAARIFGCSGFAPPGFAEWVIDRSKDRLVAASVNDTSGTPALRTARDCAFGPQESDLVIAIMQERASRITGVPVVCHEPPNTISYEPGQQFGLHVDYVDPNIPEFQAELQTLGQRVATVVTYLNDDFEGAETCFPDANIKFRGGVGDAVIFANVLENGQPDRMTTHFAPAPTRGRKWVLSQWIRSKPFPFRPEDLV